MQMNNNMNMNNMNYGVYHGPARYQMTPMSIFSKPQVPRVLSFLSLCFLSAGIALVVTFATSEDQFDSFGFMVGGMFCLFIGFVMGMISLSACCAVKSLAYIMMPCCVSESERKRLEEQAKARTPMLNVMGMMPVVMNQQQMQMMNYQQQVGGFQYAQVQPTIVVQNPMQGAPQQQFANQQQNVVHQQQNVVNQQNVMNQQNMAQPYMPAPMQAPSAITAPVELEISPVM
ncbi:Hypothetical_protein [Hexamita inflata]|uniref:Hypothetical_protein n=1 Tax=Hexamita inflata TaxID=28002 RepID=A0AA86UYU8_9EUKA|nr:Hypothetical protein HINF_LOCUS65130 [Hexamita inflata]